MAVIGVVADTHVPHRLPCLPANLKPALRGVDLILHAGDISSPSVLMELAEIAPVQAVAGNADLLGHRLPLTRVVEIEGRRIGLVHGHGGWARYLMGKVRDQLRYSEEYYVRIAQRSFGSVDAIVFGHTHRAFCQTRAGVLLFNPGPVAPDYYFGDRPQVGLLRVEADRIEAEVIAL